MTEHPGFGTMLAWLLDHRELGAQELADRAGLNADEVRAVLAGDSPGEELLRRLGPALGFHAVDLFILARLAVPDDMAPLDATAAMWVRNTVTDAVRLPAAGRRELLQLVRSLPQEERCSSFAPKPLMPLAGGPGAWVIRMLQYRNLNWTGMAVTLAFVTPTYLSAATYGVIGSGRKELTPRLVTDFAALLGIDARDLAALTGVMLTEVPPPPAPEAVDAAALLWEARRLSAAQARHTFDLARSMRGDSHDAHLMEPPGSDTC
ncbi:hypothetical protein [Streptomyces sp. NBC_01373]|uniref:hypothetical protein n=1 Tax=Streptomyces sp. NBC_01373 TaxID=2903843 RepID=UPI002253A414|nr:hypothetical protein [Streptomyces sp. NBC_01373]MCX4704190.1 hypothetical protein [Streptomyces sp. NBC_01373]